MSSVAIPCGLKYLESQLIFHTNFKIPAGFVSSTPYALPQLQFQELQWQQTWTFA